MTPAVREAQQAGLEFETLEYDHDPKAASYGEEAAHVLGQDPAQVFKTLVVKLDGQRLAVGIVPVNGQLDLKAMAASQKAKKAAMAPQAEAERATGYVLGGISPLGQKRRLPTTVDASARQFEHVFVSGGKRGLELKLKPEDLITLCQAACTAIARARP